MKAARLVQIHIPQVGDPQHCISRVSLKGWAISFQVRLLIVAPSVLDQ